MGTTPMREYLKDSIENKALRAELEALIRTPLKVPNVIGGQEILTDRTFTIRSPHNHTQVLGTAYIAGSNEVNQAIEAALRVHKDWSSSSMETRIAIFEKAAKLIEFGPWREKLNAATILELSKTFGQADGDAGSESVDFIKANISNMRAMYDIQPASTPGVHNQMEYRPLEGFVLAITPFNFTSMNNLAFGPALLGNTVVWKPAESASLVAYLSLQILREAGLPDGVINLIHGKGSDIGPQALQHPDLGAVHFTGSTATFQNIWKTIAENITSYKSYPRIVGETGGKGFVLVHPSADIFEVSSACIKAAFEYQGQKCSAATRLYVPESLWPHLCEELITSTNSLSVGDPTLPETFLSAVITEKQFNLHLEVIEEARKSEKILAGGIYEKTTGWFVYPTIIQTQDPHSKFMTEEFFGPILTVYVYKDSDWAETVRLVDNSTIYGLTGSVFASDSEVLLATSQELMYAAGNFYLNDKPSGATVGEQPFGGSRASGTNDKTGTVWNLARFVTPRSVKEKLPRQASIL